MITINIHTQIHNIQVWWVTEEVSLWELFQDYPWSEQIIRFRENIRDMLDELLASWNVHLFNTTDPINNELISRYRNGEQLKGVIATVTSWVILQESLQVVKVSHMQNMHIQEIKDQWLAEKSIPQTPSVDELLHWLWKDFYWQEEVLKVDSLLFRNISL